MLNAYAVDMTTWLIWNGRDQWTELLSGGLAVVNGYVEWKQRLVTDVRGAERMSPVKIWYPKRRLEAALGREPCLEDRVIIEGESHDREIIQISRPKDFSGVHYEVYLA